MDIIRVTPQVDIVWDLLKRCTQELPYVPMEAWSLAEILTNSDSKKFLSQPGEELNTIMDNLRRIRKQGQENLWW